ncbi:MAG: endolytic transglycosylase MltG [Patescibacteria group bacterium]|nr:endolytic transglycosylase MltG [Patescibacteria group bacterium]
MKKNHGIILSVLGALAVIFVGAYLLWLAPANYRGEAKLFVVDSGQSITQIITGLHTEGLVKSVFGTKIAFRLSRVTAIKDGSYNISPRMDAWQIARLMRMGETSTVRLTIPEGFTINQIAERMDALGLITAKDFIVAAENFPPDYDFLKSRANNSLEGYLFPDTYNMNKGTAADVLARQMLNNFSSRTKSLTSQIESSSYSLHEIITLASLVEKEARTDEVRKMVAGILINRLDIGMRLDVDATVRYLTNNWKGPITQSDLNINSPYNTRRFAGLPPGPICNPGLAAIKAVLSPTDSDYLYYLHDDDGNTYYAKTLSEHNANKAKYL